MDIDTYSIIGLAIPLAGAAYAVMQKPKPVAWLMIVPSVVFLFIGAVPNSGLAPIGGYWANASDGRYLFGTLITIGGAILLVISCWANTSWPTSNKPAASDRDS